MALPAWRDTAPLPPAAPPPRPLPPAGTVCFLSAAHPPEDVRVVVKQAATLAAAGYTVHHIAPAAQEARWTAHGVAVTTYTRRPGLPGRLLALPALTRRAARAGADVLHANEPDAWLAAMIAARRTGARVVLDIHEHYPSTFAALHVPRPLARAAAAAVRAFIRWATRRADATVVAKDGLTDDCRGRVVAARNYALLATAPRPAPPRITGTPVIVHAGAMTRARGWPVLLDALSRMRAPARLWLIGRFTDGSAPDFRARVAGLGLEERVRVDGWMPHAEMMAELTHADVAAVLFQPGLANHTHALPHKLFDAMAAGLPVIAPRHAREVADAVRDAGAGLIVDAADPDSVALALDRLAADPALRARMGAAGRAAVERRYCWEREGEALVALYRDLIPG